MKKTIKLTENDLKRIVLRVLNEDIPTTGSPNQVSTGMNHRLPGTPPDPRKLTSAERQSGEEYVGTQGLKTINPKINIDCNRRVILNSQLPKLDKTANYTIINYYCNKK